ncbi:MAG: heparan-alpha-glucosaminide N-acetyltransferase domain-containing protein [Anaerolineae bacterium]|nr:heparan-alpha-glucosaminide N-acetyltransferase domain-containing protein [Anaerolineae bacterium]
MHKRLFAIDAVRGWVMIFMALDHAVLFTYYHISAELFQGKGPDAMPDTLHYLTRFITHYCAPTFVFLAGLSIALYSLSRRSQGLSEGQITRKLVTRGLLILLLKFTVVNFIWGFGPNSSGALIYFGVLACIGSGMVILAFARRLPAPVLAAGSLLLLLAMPLLLRALPLLPGSDQPLLEVLLQPSDQGWIWVYYPILPWLGVMGLGCACGRWLGERPERTTKFFLALGALLLMAWLPVRLAGTYGNLVPYQAGDWRDFFLMSKYPPSLAFLTCTLGGMSLAIAVHNLLEKRLSSTRFFGLVTLFGRTPLFFYVVHLQLYKLISSKPLLRGDLAKGYLAWLIGLALMVPLCLGYQALKRRYPHSVLQYV